MMLLITLAANTALWTAIVAASVSSKDSLSNASYFMIDALCLLNWVVLIRHLRNRE